MNSTQLNGDYTAAFSQAFFMANLVFVGIFYVALCGLYLAKYQHTSLYAQQHLKQSLLASTISSLIFIAINLFIILNDGYASFSGLLSLEIYFMLIVPLFLLLGLLSFSKALQGEKFKLAGVFS